jgi:hypothetical protein
MHAIALLAAPQNDNDYRTDPEVVADANGLSDFIADAMPGASIAYHLGGLALLPDAGGVNDQAAWTMAALGMIGSIHAEQEEYERKAGRG